VGGVAVLGMDSREIKDEIKLQLSGSVALYRDQNLRSLIDSLVEALANVLEKNNKKIEKDIEDYFNQAMKR